MRESKTGHIRPQAHGLQDPDTNGNHYDDVQNRVDARGHGDKTIDQPQPNARSRSGQGQDQSEACLLSSLFTTPGKKAIRCPIVPSLEILRSESLRRPPKRPSSGVSAAGSSPDNASGAPRVRFRPQYCVGRTDRAESGRPNVVMFSESICRPSSRSGTVPVTGRKLAGCPPPTAVAEHTPIGTGNDRTPSPIYPTGGQAPPARMERQSLNH
jgi:hypothetical protein